MPWMNIVLWVLQLLLAAGFFAHGWLFLFPPPDLVELMNASIAPWFRIFLGVAEVAAAVGLILPGVTRILPWLVPAAAAGVMAVMVSATIFHVARGEWGSAGATIVIFAAATVVAYLRWKVHPIRPRSGAPAWSPLPTAKP